MRLGQTVGVKEQTLTGKQAAVDLLPRHVCFHAQRVGAEADPFDDSPVASDLQHLGMASHHGLEIAVWREKDVAAGEEGAGTARAAEDAIQ